MCYCSLRSCHSQQAQVNREPNVLDTGPRDGFKSEFLMSAHSQVKTSVCYCIGRYNSGKCGSVVGILRIGILRQAVLVLMCILLVKSMSASTCKDFKA